jgi:hypothetical protein
MFTMVIPIWLAKELHSEVYMIHYFLLKCKRVFRGVDNSP